MDNFLEDIQLLSKSADDQTIISSCYDFVNKYDQIKKITPIQMEALFHVFEDNFEIDFGIGGPLINFIEKFPNYETELVNSLYRKPTDSTFFMLRRIRNAELRGIVTIGYNTKEEIRKLLDHLIKDSKDEFNGKLALELKNGWL